MADKFVRNLTPKRLTIKGAGNSVILLAPLDTSGPFDEKELEGSFGLSRTSPLIARNLVALDDAPMAKTFDWVGSTVYVVAVVGFLGAIVVNTKAPEYLAHFLITGALVVLIGLPLAFLVAWKGRDVILRILSQILSLVVILAIGVGLPGAAIYFFGGGAIHDGTASLALLGRLLQLAFVATASLLPALLYFLFDRQQLRTLRGRFEQQIFRLDPTVANLSEVRAKYGRQMDEAYGQSSSGEGRLIRGTRWPILVATLVMSLGWILTLAPVGESPNADGPAQLLDLFRPQLATITFGFLGAYFFGLNTVLRRYVRGDLKPKAYSSITVRIIVVVILAWVIGVMFADRLDAVRLPLVFLVGIVPETGLTLIREALARRKGLGRLGGPLEERHPLTDLEGIDLYDRSRLMDEGVTNIEGLAHHDLIDLMLETRIPVPRLVDWVDQAILYLHLPQNSDRERLRAYGIRTATDLEHAVNATEGRAATKACASEAPKAGDSMLQLMDGGASSSPPRFRVILDALGDDEWLPCIRHWRATTGVAEETVDATSSK